MKKTTTTILLRKETGGVGHLITSSYVEVHDFGVSFTDKKKKTFIPWWNIRGVYEEEGD
jgi:hypothetical protein